MACRKVMPGAVFVVLLVTGAAAVAQQADDRPKKEKHKGQFLRLALDADKAPVALEAAIVRHAPANGGKRGPTVDLVAAVHVAEKGYFELLNREFRKYDAVLYELVAPEGTKVPKGGGSGGSPVSLLQNAIKDLLELEFQLSQIDYTPKNMIHADMSPEQFVKSMRRRGENVFTVFLRMLGYALARQGQQSGKSTDAELLMALFDKNRALALKRILAEQFEDMEGMLVVLDGPDGSTIVSERNKVALKVLRKQIATGKRKIAIFYGAGHMADLQKRLRDDFGLSPISTRWVVAWDLKSKPKVPQKAPAGGAAGKHKAAVPSGLSPGN